MALKKRRRVTGIPIKTGTYQVLTEAWIPKTIVDELGSTTLDQAPISSLAAALASLLTTSNTQTALHGMTNSASGNPVGCTVLYELR